jgi:hypothetical protein
MKEIIIMTENHMSIIQAIEFHLTNRPPAEGIHIFSGFVAALRDARAATGRDEFGRKVDHTRVGCWLGAIGYMALLDQIGTCFKPKKNSYESGTSVHKALKYFSNLSDDKIEALYALRCCFAHDFSLHNINRKKPSRTHRFRVGVGASEDIVSLPSVRWDENYESVNLDDFTTINLEALGDLVESICQQLFTLANSGELEIVLPGGSDELLHRYSIYTLTEG